MKHGKLGGRIPVEPLDDERWTNIERRIVAGAADAATARPLRAPRLGFALGFAVAAVVAIGAGFAGWQLRGGGGMPVVAEAPVHVRTDALHATLDIGDATIESDSATDFTVSRPAGGVLISMKRGKVALDVGKRKDRAPLVVAAGDTRVIVVGTQFSVDYGDGTGAVEVRVTEGIVQVERHQQVVRVAAGHGWTSERGLLALAELPAAGGAAAVVASSDPLGEPPTAKPGGRPSTARPGIDPDEPVDASHDRGVTPPTPVPAPGTSGATGSAGTGATIPRDGSGRAITGGTGRAITGGTEPARGIKARIRAAGIDPALDVGVSDPAQALAAYYQKMRDEKGRTEAHAFYSIAVVQHRQGEDAAAEKTLNTYITRRAPTTEYFTAALWLRLRVRCLRALDEPCRDAAAAYLKRAPDGERAEIARVLVSK